MMRRRSRRRSRRAAGRGRHAPPRCRGWRVRTSRPCRRRGRRRPAGSASVIGSTFGCERCPCRDLDRVGAPQLTMAPRARGCVELGDPLGDVLPGGQRRVGEPAHELVRVHDVGVLGDRLAGVDVVLGRAVELRRRCRGATGPAGSTRTGCAGRRRTPSGLPPGLMPLGITKALGYGTIQSWFSASKPRSARNGSSQQVTRGALLTLRIAIVSWSCRISARWASQ